MMLHRAVKGPVLIALAIAGIAILWIASGAIWKSEASKTPTAAEKTVTKFRVAVRQSRGQTIVRSITVQGALHPSRSVVLRSEVSGLVAEILARKGALLKAGDPIVRIAVGDREARLAKAKAKLAQASRDYQSAAKLGKKGYQTGARIAALKAEMESAAASLAEIELEIKRLTIRASFAGVLNARPVEKGDYLGIRDEVATVIEIDPIVAVADVAQQNVAALKVGGKARLRTLNGQEVTGRIRFISAQAAADTRTFRVEIEIPNPDGKLLAGSSLVINLPVETVKAHFMSPQLLVLGSDKNELGVMTVDETDRVVFRKVRVVRATTGGIWVSGLPDGIRLIVRGHGFVRPGEAVAVKPAKAVAER